MALVYKDLELQMWKQRSREASSLARVGHIGVRFGELLENHENHQPPLPALCIGPVPQPVISQQVLRKWGSGLGSLDGARRGQGGGRKS